jgi:hypothetical protein
MQQEHGRDGLQVGAGQAGRSFAQILVPAALLLAALGWAATLVVPPLEEARCLGYWDDGTKVVVSPAWSSDACRWLHRSPCYPAGFADQAPVRHVFFGRAPLELLRLAYAPDGDRGDTRVERCGSLTSLRAEAVPEPGQLLTTRLKEARVELRHVDGHTDALTRSGERFPCGKGRSWCWVGPSTLGGVPVLRAHLVQAARVAVAWPKRDGEQHLDLRFGFTPDGERRRATLFGFARLRVRSGGRTLYTGTVWPGLGDRGSRISLAAVPAGGTLELLLEGVGSRFGELWIFGRLAP